MATKQEIAQIVGVISAAYPNFSPSPQTVEVYFQSLSDLEYAELKTATMQSVTEAGRKFAPSVGEIRGSVLELRKQVANLPSSYQAWQEVLRQVLINGGDFGVPVWSNPIVEQAVKTLGWRNIRMSENQVADRARFIEAFEQLSSRADKDLIALPEVKGYIEQKQGARLEMQNLTKRLEQK